MQLERVGKPKNVYLYFYTDSVAFPRKKDQSPNITWPFQLKDLLESDGKLRVYPYIRGLGGARITEIEEVFNRDVGYFKCEGNESLSFAILNTGVVDAAPRPFTYHLKKLGAVPYIGKYIAFIINSILHRNRKLLQTIYAFRLTSPSAFSNSFNHMIGILNKANISPISIDTPLTPIELEDRSPGLRQSIALYNSLKHRNTAVFHVQTDWVTVEHYLDCGHHFSEVGHRELAQRLYQYILTKF